MTATSPRPLCAFSLGSLSPFCVDSEETFLFPGLVMDRSVLLRQT